MTRRQPTQALSVRAPWWWFLLYGGKDIENRDTLRHFRGRIWLHASGEVPVGRNGRSSQTKMERELREATLIARGCGHPGGRTPPTLDTLRGAQGCIVGSVDIVGSVEESDSPWFVGKYGFITLDPKPLKVPVPSKGSLGIWTVPDEVLAGLNA